MQKRYIAGIVLSLAALALFFFQVPFGEMLSTLYGVDPWFLLLSAAIYSLSYLIRAVRWQILLRPLGSTSLYSALCALVVGFMGNNLLPAHLGEFIRAYVLKKQEGHSVPASMASIVLERVFDGLTVLLFLVLILMFIPLPEHSSHSFITLEMLRDAAWFAGACFLGMLAVLQLLWWRRRWSLSMVKKLSSPLPDAVAGSLMSIMEEFAGGLSLVNLSSLLAVCVTSVVTWGMLALFTWLLFPAFGVELGYMEAMLVQVVLVLAMLIPAAPGAVGTFHLASANILMFLGVGDGLAGSIAMTIWSIHYVLTNLFGLWFIWRNGLGFDILSSKIQKKT